MTKRSGFILVFITLIFLALRVPGTSLPLHQDEYKWPLIVNPATNTGTNIPHPPLGEFIYRTAGYAVGFDTHFRLVPLAFGFVNLFLLWYWLRRRAGEKAALWGAALFTLSFFSILASLMVDTDGQILPFFLLLALIAYDHSHSDWRWWLGVGLACTGGFLVKASFVLAIGAIAADMLWERRAELLSPKVVRFAGVGIAILAGLVGVLVLSSKVFTFFDLSASLSYWEHFASLHHNWFQVAIQAAKAAFYLSPLLVLMPLLATRDDFERVRPLVFFTLFGLIFYLVLFDFSLGALDRYLQFLIVPLVSLSAVLLARFFPRVSDARPYSVLTGTLLALGIFAAQYTPQAVPSLYPKAAWIGRVASLDWNFLYPFSGGSGPLTFYVSFAFLGGMWLVSFAIVAIARVSGVWRPLLLAMLLPVALVYNITFTEEYLAGRINGFAPGLVQRAAAYIASDPDIQKVVVYNDNGGAEVQQTGKYEKRLYTSPDFDWQQKVDTMNAFKGHYLIVDAPPIDPASFFVKYFATCRSVYQDSDGYMHASILDCRQAPPAVL